MQITTRSRTRLIANPSEADLQALWQVTEQDPTVVGSFTDCFPQTWEEFRAMLHGPYTYCWLAAQGNDIVGAHWLHDWGNWGTPDSSWIACYRVPQARGQYACVTSARLAHEAAQTLGVNHLFCAIRVNNRPAQILARRTGYYRVALFPQWAYFEGELDDVWVYSLQPNDHDMLLVQALMRSASQAAPQKAMAR